LRADARPDNAVVTALQLSAHNVNWRLAFHREQSRVRAALGVNLLQMHHVGATAVHGLLARPTIDMLGVVRSIDQATLRGGALAALGYITDVGHAQDDALRYSRDDDEPPSYSLLLCAFGHRAIDDAVALRDFLRATHAAVTALNADNQALVAQCAGDMACYARGHATLLDALQTRARQWQAALG
jgi:GrpB-like predicted nucleotidyltransferase (UPF0157 family)